MVTPLVGVWIEMSKMESAHAVVTKSLPLWECGLKYTESETRSHLCQVTPLVGVWIEIIRNKRRK